MSAPKPTEADGIKAIIYLQDMAGIKEPRAKAKRGWRAMSDHEKEHTIQVYRMFNRARSARLNPEVPKPKPAVPGPNDSITEGLTFDGESSFEEGGCCDE